MNGRSSLRAWEKEQILLISPAILDIPAWMPPDVNPILDRTGAVTRPGTAITTTPVVPTTAQVARIGFRAPQLAACRISAIKLEPLQYIESVYEPELLI